MSGYMKEAERLVSDLISAVDFEDQSAETKARAALLAHIQRGAVPEGDDGKRVLREVFALCEDTETQCSHAPEELNDFNRGRAFEAKGIARAIGTWYQEEFCGRTHMGEHERRIGPASDADMAVYQSIADGYTRDTVPAPADVPSQHAGARMGTEEGGEAYTAGYFDGEAAGYARGVKGADKLAHTLMICRETFKRYADLHAAKCTDDGRDKAAANMRLVGICDAALRGEVKP